MSISPQYYAQFIGLSITLGGIIFKGGQMSHNLDDLGFKVNALEKKTSANYDNINGIHNTLSVIKTDLAYMKKDIHDMKIKIDAKLK